MATSERMHPIFEVFTMWDVPTFHLVIEAVLILLLVYVFSLKRYRPKELRVKLTKEEEEELLREWKPEPLVEPVERDLPDEGPVVQGAAGVTMTVNNKEVINMGTYNFLGFVGDKRAEEAAIKSVRHYGVGSCGPRGFYGTIDCHQDLEEKVAAFIGAEECILYSFGFATIASAIPAYSKRGDLIFCDEQASFAIQKGLEASRSKVVFFKHNDMADLKAKLEKQAVIDRQDRKKALATRRFIVVEGIYANTGSICPLDELVKLKYQYKTRLIVEESMSFGVLGNSGKGVTEHFGVKVEDVDMICVSLGMALGSIGGFCCGRSFVVDHQRLSGQGYCFSASLPPLLANAAICNLDILSSDEGKGLLRDLRSNIALVHESIHKIEQFEMSGEVGSALVHAHIAPHVTKRLNLANLNQEDHKLQDICEKALSKGVAFVRASYITSEEKFPRRPSIRIAVSARHTREQLTKAMDVLAQIAQEVLS